MPCRGAARHSIRAAGARRSGTDTATLLGTGGPGFTITLKTAQGTIVRKLQAGAYAIRIRDLLPIHNFHLSGSGVNS